MITTTNTITIEDILQEIYGDTNTLGRSSIQIFIDAIGVYDPTYKVGDGNNFLSFRGYQHVKPTMDVNLQHSIGGVNISQFSDEDLKCLYSKESINISGFTCKRYSTAPITVGEQLYGYMSPYYKITFTGTYFYGGSSGSTNTFTIYHIVNGVITAIILSDTVTASTGC